jgi:hypothetical protein
MLDQMRRPSCKHARKSLHHPDRPIRRSQQVIAPPANAATTSRPSPGANPNKSLLHRIGIGGLRETARNR